MIERTLRESVDTIRSVGPVRRALEVGALPSRFGILANTPWIDERLGVNLTEEGEVDGFSVALGDARDLAWPDGYFDLVVSNSMLEHVPDFWRACDEMKRVLAPGGTLLLSAPGFGTLLGENRMHRFAARMRLPDVLRRGTVTMRVHDVDYYRFSETAFREVLMSGLDDVRVWRIMTPPRVFAIGRRPLDA